jgi:hypothetical protein
MVYTQVQLTSLQSSLADAERRVYESELIRRKLHNTIQVRNPSPVLAHASCRHHTTAAAWVVALLPTIYALGMWHCTDWEALGVDATRQQHGTHHLAAFWTLSSNLQG